MLINSLFKTHIGLFNFLKQQKLTTNHVLNILVSEDGDLNFTLNHNFA